MTTTNSIPGFQDFEKGEILLKRGLVDDAAEAFRAAAANGLAEGYVQLAEIERERGRYELARAHMREAEKLAEQGDALANLSLSFAYQIGFGLGDEDGSFEEREQKSRNFLYRSAELGHPAAQTMLAISLLHGLNDFQQDLSGYEKWIWCAIRQDHENAVISHVENRLHMRRDIEPEVVAKLKTLSSQSERAKKLLLLLGQTG